jgi:DNA gyrase subunit A
VEDIDNNIETIEAAASDAKAGDIGLARGIKNISIEDELSKSYLDYAMSVIIARALPDVRDGMKPVHRRIIYAMRSIFASTEPYKKSARAVGEIMGKYHPHGDSAIYDTMVRMAQPFKMRHPLIDGQGNFGSIDGDMPAAMRYTEARLFPLSHTMINDLDKDTVDFVPNYDASTTEPSVLPARFPNLLVNGSEGIAVAMATSVPPHNLGESLDACLLVLNNPDASVDDIIEVMPGPDFPTHGVIMGRGGIRQAYATGRGSIRMSGVAEIEPMKSGKSKIVISEIPFGVNKKKLIERIAELHASKTIDGITDIADQSDRKANIRIVVELRRDVDPQLVLNGLRKHTDFVCTFSVNMNVLNSRGRPELMGIQQVLAEFIAFRRQTVRRRTIFELNKNRDSLHRQIGLYAAVSLVDEVVKAIRTSSDVDAARVKLMAMEFPTSGDFAKLLVEADPDIPVGDVFKLSAEQTKAILDLRLQKLTGLEREEIAKAALEFSVEINRLITILNDKALIDEIIRNEFNEVKAKWSTPRRTKIESVDMEEIDDEELIERKDIVITITKSGYVKRTDLDAYREQRRGGKGRNGMETKDDDFVVTSLACTTRTPLVFFTSRGIAHSLKAYRLPEGAPSAKGRPLVNYVPLRSDETISAVIAMPENEADLEGESLIFVTDFGTIRRNSAKAFWGINKAGKIAIRLDDDLGNSTGKLVEVLLASDAEDVLISTEDGTCVRFPIEDVRIVKSRDGTGVKAIELESGNRVIGATILKHFRNTPQERDAYLAGGTVAVKQEDGTSIDYTLTPERIAEMDASQENLLTISALGFGKRSTTYGYRITSRGRKGIAAAIINQTTGPLVSCFTVTDNDGLVLVTDGGQTIRTRARDVRQTSRVTRGVRMFSLPAGQVIVSIVKVNADDMDDADIVVPVSEPEAYEGSQAEAT